MVAKTIGFRPSTEEQEIIANYMQAKGIKKSSKAIKQIIRDFATLQIQLEHKPPDSIKEQTPKSLSSSHSFSQSEQTPTTKRTGTLINCPLRSLPVKLFNKTVQWKPPVDSSVCETCPKYPCESWLDIESWKRTTPKEVVVSKEKQKKARLLHMPRPTT